MEAKTLSSELPGFRFHPTEEELLNFYLRNIVFGTRSQFHVIGFLNIYRHDPRDLPGLAKIGEREWYFFVPRDRKHSNGGRPKRTTEHGFWKATGSDRKVVSHSEPKRVIGYRKTLVFYKGRAPRGTKTDWVMNEYRLPDNYRNMHQDVVLCKVYRKATSLKVLEQWAAKEEEGIPKSVQFQESSYPASPLSCNLITNTAVDAEATTMTSTGQQDLVQPISNSYVAAAAPPPPLLPHLPKQEETEMDLQMYEEIVGENKDQLQLSILDEYDGGLGSNCSTSLRSPFGLPELQVPKLDWWAQDLFGAQIRSPCLDFLNLFTPSPNLLNI